MDGLVGLYMPEHYKKLMFDPDSCNIQNTKNYGPCRKNFSGACPDVVAMGIQCLFKGYFRGMPDGVQDDARVARTGAF